MSQPAHQTDTTATGTGDVNTRLTADATSTSGRTKAPARRSTARKRRRAEVENTDYAAFAARVIRAHARRIADGDVEGSHEFPFRSTATHEQSNVAIAIRPRANARKWLET